MIEPIRTTAAHTLSFEEFVLNNSIALQDFAFLVIGNREDALDAVQDALIGAFKHWHSMSHNPGAYVRRSIVNANITAWRKRRKETPTADFTWSQSQADAPGVETMWVRRICGQLPRKQRAAIVMRCYEDMSFADIGTALGCSAASARSLYQRGVTKLRTIMNGEK
ncbi:MAG: sigma-70 family RNA polymerase sigma factor [Propionibacteriaceae bacterium]|jgi:RNA polymerase sigma factor (sigma-70 family)|nr:sigma-70 family RNA polymerase sigma factor [Propionibacteriaceae bacterium]